MSASTPEERARYQSNIHPSISFFSAHECFAKALEEQRADSFEVPEKGDSFPCNYYLRYIDRKRSDTARKAEKADRTHQPPSHHIITVYPGAILSGQFDEPIQQLYCEDCEKNVGASSGCTYFQQPGGTVLFPIRGIHLKALYHDSDFPGNTVSFKMIHNQPIKIKVSVNPGPEFPTIQGYSCMEDSCNHIPPFKILENTDHTQPWCNHFGPASDHVSTPCACSTCSDHRHEHSAKKPRRPSTPSLSP